MMRIYVVSIQAFKEIEDIPGATGPLGTYVETVPALQPAESIEAAGEFARVKCFERWPFADGWSQHRAVVVPVTQFFYDAVIKANMAGILESTDDPSEMPGRDFKF